MSDEEYTGVEKEDITLTIKGERKMNKDGDGGEIRRRPEGQTGDCATKKEKSWCSHLFLMRSDRAQIPKLHFGREKPTPTKDLLSRQRHWGSSILRYFLPMLCCPTKGEHTEDRGTVLCVAFGQVS